MTEKVSDVKREDTTAGHIYNHQNQVVSGENVGGVSFEDTVQITSEVDDSARGLRDRLENSLEMLSHILSREGYITIRPRSGLIDDNKQCPNVDTHSPHVWYIAMSHKPGSQEVWSYTCLGGEIA